MAIELLMPQHGLNMSEGTVAELLVKVGDTVKTDDLLFVFETDKATVEFRSPQDGVITKVLAQEGDAVPVNDVVLLLEEGSAPPKEQPQAALTPELPKEDGYVPATPYVKHLAKEHGVNLAAVSGSGLNDRITGEDVLRAAAPAAVSPPEAVPAPAPAAPPAPAQTAPVPAPAYAPPQGTELKLSRIKKVTGERMAYSFREVPHIYFSASVNLSRLKVRREELQRETGDKYTYSDFILAAVARALVRYPIANASFRDGKLYSNPDVNIGFATATDKGLLVPVVHQAQDLSLKGIASRRAQIVKKALSGNLDISEMEGGTFTVTNLGSYGIDTFDPIVNPPEAAILAVGSISDQVFVTDGAIRICPMLQLRLAADHRVLDGADCAKCLGTIKSLLQLDEPFL